jgi:hypothetical protein
MSSNWDIISAFGIQYIFGEFQRLNFADQVETARKVYQAAYAFRQMRAPVHYESPVFHEDEARRWSRLAVNAVKEIPGVQLYTFKECCEVRMQFMRECTPHEMAHVDFYLRWTSVMGWKHMP